jgi:hypothetical protein
MESQLEISRVEDVAKPLEVFNRHLLLCSSRALPRALCSTVKGANSRFAEYTFSHTCMYRLTRYFSLGQGCFLLFLVLQAQTLIWDLPDISPQILVNHSIALYYQSSYPAPPVTGIVWYDSDGKEE